LLVVNSPLFSQILNITGTYRRNLIKLPGMMNKRIRGMDPAWAGRAIPAFYGTRRFITVFTRALH
jgi:hypothetical protein